jgi:hypothetical protein
MNLCGVLLFHRNILTTISVYLLNTHLLNLSSPLFSSFLTKSTYPCFFIHLILLQFRKYSKEFYINFTLFL